MTEEDEVEFVTMSQDITDSVDKSSDIQWFFHVGDCRIQLLRCSSDESQLLAGRISIATTGFGASYKSSQEAEKVYKRMRNWLKKSYSNRMTCRNVGIEGSKTELKTFWASPRVIEKVNSNPELVLRQIHSAPVVFELKD